MTKTRLEAFSDGVFAIIITIMALELKPPQAHTWRGIGEIWPTFVSYGLSFFYVGVYWVNHHHLLHTLRQVKSRVMWLNVVMLMASGGYHWLARAIAAQHAGEHSRAAHEHHNRKTKLALLLYAMALPLAWFGWVHVALALYFAVALAYVVPERRFEGLHA